MNKKMSSIAKLALVGFTVVTLAGCDLLDKVKGMLGGKKDQDMPAQVMDSEEMDEPSVEAKGDVGSKTLVYLGDDKEPVLNVNEFKKYLGQILKMYPQLNGAVDVDNLPAAFKKNFLNKIVDQKLIVKQAKQEKYEADAKFQKDLDDAVRLLKEHMLLQEYEKRIVSGIEITDSEVRSEYNNNKATKYLKNPGGVVVSGVEFGNSENAEKFLADAQGKNTKAFVELGEKSPGMHKEFGLVNDKTHASAVPTNVKNASLKVNAFPSVQVVKDSGKTWVVHVAEKKKPEFYAFDDIKGQIEGHLKQQKFQASFNKKIEGLRKQYPIKINEDLLEPVNA